MVKREEIQERAFMTAIKHKRSTLAISVGVGKTFIGLKIIEYFELMGSVYKVLLVGPKLSIYDTWKKEVVDRGLDPTILNIIDYTTYLSLPKRSLDYDLIIMDEVHNITPAQEEWLACYQGKILGLTGSPPKSKYSVKAQLIQRFCPVVYEYITDDAVEAQILNDYRIIVHMLELNTEKTLLVETKKVTFKTSERLNYEYWCDRVENAVGAKQKQLAVIMRMKALMGFKTKENYARRLFNHIEEKCLLFCNTQEQADTLCTHSYHSNNPNSEYNMELFQKGAITKLSCVLQISEGINIKGLKRGIIMHSYNGSSPKTQQRFGRLLRLNPDDTCMLHILCFKDTVDNTWVNSALENLDHTKIQYYEPTFQYNAN